MGKNLPPPNLDFSILSCFGSMNEVPLWSFEDKMGSRLGGMAHYVFYAKMAQKQKLVNRPEPYSHQFQPKLYRWCGVLLLQNTTIHGTFYNFCSDNPLWLFSPF